MFVDFEVPDTMPTDCIDDITTTIRLSFKGWLNISLDNHCYRVEQFLADYS